MKAPERPIGIPSPPLYPGEARRVLREFTSHSAKVSEIEYAPGLCLARHAHEIPQFIYVIAGLHWSGHSRGGDSCAPGTVRFIPAGEAHENYFPAGSRCLGVKLFRPILELARADGALLGASGELASPSAPVQGARLHREFHRRDDLSGLAVESLLMELLVAGVRPAPLRRGPAPAWLLRVREMLHEHGSCHLTLAELSRCAGRHPVQVSRRFRYYFGCTISEYVRQVRIARAQILLSRRDMSIAEIALASGFSDQSHFSNAFRKRVGIPPHRFRLLNTLASARA